MKKAIAILMVLLVAGVMFAADATLTLTSTMAAKTNHGFSSIALNYLQIINGQIIGEEENTDAFDLNDKVYPVDFTDSSTQGIGYYSFATNASTSISVTLTINALHNEDTDYEVPYTLGYTKGENSTAGVVSGTKKVGSDVKFLNDSDVSTETITLANSLAGSGPSWGTYALTATFDPTDIEAKGLPAETYTGDIVATITTT
ncbi:MAG: hypothetical protein WDA17_04925 [Sphaerochaetaceae bacterium]